MVFVLLQKTMQEKEMPHSLCFYNMNGTDRPREILLSCFLGRMQIVWRTLIKVCIRQILKYSPALKVPGMFGESWYFRVFFAYN